MQSLRPDELVRQIRNVGSSAAVRPHLAIASIVSGYDAGLPFSIGFVLDGVLHDLAQGHLRLLAAVVLGILLISVPFAVALGLTKPQRPHDIEHRSIGECLSSAPSAGGLRRALDQRSRRT
ncbi:MAG: hypothetical protein JWP01_2838 [Myxococcales bacterium]|nr:hypothetical protein [Myxococcales bacterium]